ncbi:MAG TPA: acetylornithine deacetylase [Steroidobacteraceae bacterium]|nr:acetylornithine deacetylase [Steroidobacteraceae bacterium]
MESIRILERLVACATVSRDSNLELIEYVREFLSARGIEARLYRDATAPKSNLYARIGPPVEGGMLLSGHTDVVPVDGQRWSCDPFRLTERSGRLFARGAADMKGFLACALRAAERAATRTLRSPLHLAFSYDEEVGCLGVRSLIDDMASWTQRPAFCIVGEPTLLRTAVGHKGKTALRARCHGRAAHSAAPDRGVNAIYMACELIGAVRRRQLDIAHSAVRDPAYQVPHTTLHVGLMRGGTALNIVPADCELELEIRNVPPDDPAAIVAGIRSDARAIVRALPRHAEIDAIDARIELEPLHDYPALETPADSQVVELAAALTGNRETIKVDFGSEAGLYSSRLAIPTVVCGPGSIDQAHKPDEFVALDQLARCDAMMDALLDVLTS